MLHHISDPDSQHLYVSGVNGNNIEELWYELLIMLIYFSLNIYVFFYFL